MPKLLGTLHRKEHKRKQQEYSVLLLLQHYIICGWLLFLFAFKRTHVIQLSTISIFDLPWDRPLRCYGVSTFHTAAERGGNSLGQRQAGWYFHRHCTGEGRGCLPLLPLLFFFPPHSLFSLFCGRDQTYISVWICKSWKRMHSHSSQNIQQPLLGKDNEQGWAC